MAYRTQFFPQNKQKYVGDSQKIICRSLWERTVCKFCDDHPSIIKWSSEEIAIPYFHPIDNRVRNYYPDFLIQFQQKEKLCLWMDEVKPKKQTMLKENASKNEKYTWVVNNAKWEAAKTYCTKNNIEFKLLTEKELYNKCHLHKI